MLVALREDMGARHAGLLSALRIARVHAACAAVCRACPALSGARSTVGIARPTVGLARAEELRGARAGERFRELAVDAARLAALRRHAWARIDRALSRASAERCRYGLTPADVGIAERRNGLAGGAAARVGDCLVAAASANGGASAQADIEVEIIGRARLERRRRRAYRRDARALADEHATSTETAKRRLLRRQILPVHDVRFLDAHVRAHVEPEIELVRIVVVRTLTKEPDVARYTLRR